MGRVRCYWVVLRQSGELSETDYRCLQDVAAQWNRTKQTTYSSVPGQKLIVDYLFQKFPTFSGTRFVYTTFIRGLHFEPPESLPCDVLRLVQ